MKIYNLIKILNKSIFDSLTKVRKSRISKRYNLCHQVLLVKRKNPDVSVLHESLMTSPLNPVYIYFTHPSFLFLQMSQRRLLDILFRGYIVFKKYILNEVTSLHSVFHWIHLIPLTLKYLYSTLLKVLLPNQ